jgi:glycosyltransferase involved in cell wall biosynthesis
MLELLAVVTAVLAAIAAFQFIRGCLKLEHLESSSCNKSTGASPLVSVVLAACNEEARIEAGVRSLLAQDYPKLQIIVVNDRSLDQTGEIIKRVQQSHGELEILEIKTLPEGWMGKQHALQWGAKRALGKYLVFTDADVQFKKNVISKAVARMEVERLDHLSLLFKNITKGWLLNSFIVDAGVGLMLLFRPWAVGDPASSAFIGVGAFNMIRTRTYRSLGGHQRIRMHPIDDIMLGKMVKRAGYRQDCLVATDSVLVPWYDSISAMMSGLQKNLFSVVHYRLLLVPPLLGGVFLIGIFPVFGIFFLSGWAQAFCGMALIFRLGMFYATIRHLRLPRTLLAGVVITPFLSLFLICQVVWRTIRNGGIDWRGTHYRLSDLQRSEPLLF